MAAHDPEIRDHRNWLGLLQQGSAGLVVSPPALVRGQAIAPRGSVELQRRFLAALADPDAKGDDGTDGDGGRKTSTASRRRRLREREREPVRLVDFARLTRDFLGWEPEDLVGGLTPAAREALPTCLEVVLTEYQQVLSPTWAVPAPDAPPAKEKAARPDPSRWLMLIVAVDGGLDDVDAEELSAVHARLRAEEEAAQRAATATTVLETAEAQAEAKKKKKKKKKKKRGKRSASRFTPQQRLERLLAETGVPIGLLVNDRAIRLVYAPGSESSGYLTFPIEAMARGDGRVILGAFELLLGSARLFTLPDDRRLPALLAESRKYQNEVSTKLAEQVLRALGELLRGFVAADDAVQGALLGDLARHDPQRIYGGLVTTLMRLVFLLYAEERGLMPQEPPYAEHYGVTSLFEQLRADAGLYPDTMDQRYGAWARLLALFRLVHDGGSHRKMKLPQRRGELFDPDAYAFLEGRPYRVLRVMGETVSPPRVADGVLYRVLSDLLVLDGERISYRTLEVEEIGSVYEAIMGFEVRRAFGRSIALRPDHVVVDLDKLLEEKPAQRVKRLVAEASCKLSPGPAGALRAATTVDELVAALGSRLSPQTPTPLAAGALYLQPTEERRRSGSHYTPRSLTEPIVETTLRPVLAALGERPSPKQILGLKICDPAMGSGAFLVAACRHLAKALIKAWVDHDATPKAIPIDETVELHARRMVAQRCLYGVDRNSFAVSLAKLSLWLETLAKDHAFSFIDHALRHGDSLVGLSRHQIGVFHWLDDNDLPLFRWVAEQVTRAKDARAEILALGDEQEDEKRQSLREADEAVEQARLLGDLVVSAYFSAAKDKLRIERLNELRAAVELWKTTGDGDRELRALVDDMRGGERPILPLHWEIELPEVFDRHNPGFDAFVGNPPFGGKNTIINGNADNYMHWLKGLHEGVSGTADLVAHFFRRAFSLLRKGGSFGLIATNTIAQGDTRSAGLRWICTHGGQIYDATKRYKWPGAAAVVVSVIHVHKDSSVALPCALDGRAVDRITAFLFHQGGHEDPERLVANAGKSFIGSYVLGMGFTFDDKSADATPIAEMERLIAKDPRNAERIFPYIGGREVNSSPTHAHHRYVINFGEMSEEQAREWPDLMAIVEAKVKPERMKNKRASYRRYWWQYAEKRSELVTATRDFPRVLANSQVSAQHAFASLSTESVFAHTLNIFVGLERAQFSAMQSRIHELWARFFGSSLEERLRYTPSDCFVTFPFPENPEAEPALAAAGERYYSFRAELMVRNGEGLTSTYNRFHDPEEHDREIVQLRELHDAMDRAVLAAYGWTDLEPRCEFLLDYDEDEDESATSKKGAKKRKKKKKNKKKPWRYRWPDSVQEEVLAKLLELNQVRAEEERLAGLRGKAGKGKKKAKTKRAKKASAKKTSVKKESGKTTSGKTTSAKKESGKTTSGKKESGKTTSAKKESGKTTSGKAEPTAATPAKTRTKTKTKTKAQSKRVAKAESTSAG
ncbi:MAG TPA: hypothetical protein ENJ18_09220, partial [Nannocystis exedens]|nr:hypothetical protein [Nannocystis exedens]